MDELIDFVLTHTVRGSCECGRCIDAPDSSDQPEGHTADLMFFKVAVAGDPNRDEFARLAESITPGEGEQKNYLALGAALGDQGTALRAMGLGDLLGAWKLLTPRNMLGGLIDDDQAMKMAGMGMISIAPKQAA